MVGMPKTNSLLRFLTACSVVTGIMLIAGPLPAGLQGQLSGQGSTVMDIAGNRAEPTLHAAAVDEARSKAGQELAMGTLFILLGFFFHALWGHRNERAVRVTVVPKKPKAEAHEWFWIHMHV
jgi:hypothetical protein